MKVHKLIAELANLDRYDFEICIIHPLDEITDIVGIDLVREIESDREIYVLRTDHD